MKLLFHAILLQSIAAVSLFAGDLTITYKVKASTMLVVRNTVTLVEYHSSNFKRVSNQKAKNDVIFDYNDLIKYSIDHKKKTIGKLSLDDVNKCLEMVTQYQEEYPEEVINMGGFLGDRGFESVEKTGEAKILNRMCEEWIVEVANFVAKISVDPSLTPPIPQDGKVAMLNNISTSSTRPGYTETLGKFYDLVGQKGIPLKSYTTIPIGPITIRTSKEATKIVERAIPASVFALPDGYAMEDTGKQWIETFTKQIEDEKAKAAKKN
jgi:hypothetical protein